MLENENGQFPVNGWRVMKQLRQRWSRSSCKLIRSIKNRDSAIGNGSDSNRRRVLQKESYVEELCMQHMSYENARQEMRDITGAITNIKEEPQNSSNKSALLLKKKQFFPLI